MAYTKDNFHDDFNSLNYAGFKLEPAVQAYLFVRHSEDRLETITISYHEAPGHGYKIRGVFVDIKFLEVEKILTPLLDKFNIEKRYGNTTIQKSLGDTKNIDYSVFNTEIVDKKSFEVVILVVKQIIDCDALPFFDKYNSLTSVNEELDRMDEEEKSKFLSGIINIKIPLIKKIVKSNDFSHDLSNRKRFYEVEAPKYPRFFKDHEKVFEELFSEDIRMFLRNEN